MDKYNDIYGVDVSKDVLDLMNTKSTHLKISNNKEGFKKIAHLISKKDLIVMEATGYYYFCFAQYLSKKGYTVSVVNPLSVKRFIQMKLSKIKTDKTDAKAICDYASNNTVPIYHPKTIKQADSLQMIRLIEVYTKQTTAIKNKIHGEYVLGTPSKSVYHSLNRSLKFMNKEINCLEIKLVEMVKNSFGNKLSLLLTIPGIGQRTAMMLLILTNGFTNFENSRQLCSYVGITPTIRTSGSSVRGKSRISKMGNKKLRNLLFLCSFSAVKYNTPCKNLYERITSKGKSKKLALIAVSNKLLKQAFAIVKSNIPYNEDYISKIL